MQLKAIGICEQTVVIGIRMQFMAIWTRELILACGNPVQGMILLTNLLPALPGGGPACMMVVCLLARQV